MGDDVLMASLWSDPRGNNGYQPAGSRALKRDSQPGGIFGLWSDKVTDLLLLDQLGAVSPDCWAEPVTFDTPPTGKPFTQTVYLAWTGRA